jgi:TolB-like protein/DNA-binding winged helix-turn-helix (wHTH) protein/Tfp pilus assembly protein PilF
MEERIGHLYEFGPFRLNKPERLLLRNGEAVPLTPKAFDLLVALVERPGHLLEKDLLLKSVWHDSFVEENNLADNISRLRKVLGDGETGRRLIETVPKRGYRFVAEVKELTGESPAPVTGEIGLLQTTAANPRRSLGRQSVLILGSIGILALISAGVGLNLNLKRAAPIESLVVLPFNSDPRIEYFADGLTESLINNLSRLANLRVIARTTAFSYKGKDVNPRQIGQALNVGTMLTGRVALIDDHLTVQVDLVDTLTGTQKWGERYQRKLSDIFAVQEEIGRQVTETLRIKLSGKEQRQLSRRYTENAEVYQLYLQGLYLYSKKSADGLVRAVDCFQRAITMDPGFALAYTGLANCYSTLGAEEEPAKTLTKAKAAAIKALEIDDDLPEAHSSLGWIRWTYDLDAAGAESEYDQALRLNPNSADAHYRLARLLADTGRFEQAQVHVLKAIELDPLSVQYRKGTPYILYLSRRYDEAIAEYRKLIDLAPDFFQSQRELGLAYEQKGLYQAAFDQLQRAFAMPEDYGKLMVRADLGHLLAVWGKRKEAQQVLDDLLRISERGYVSAYDLAVIYAGLGEKDKTFLWLDKAIEQHPFWLVWLKLDPRLDGLRSDRRFAGLLRRVGLSP